MTRSAAARARRARRGGPEARPERKRTDRAFGLADGAGAAILAKTKNMELKLVFQEAVEM